MPVKNKVVLAYLRNLHTEVERQRGNAQRIHNSPSMFPDRDHKIIHIMAYADGMNDAGHRLAEMFDVPDKPKARRSKRAVKRKKK